MAGKDHRALCGDGSVPTASHDGFDSTLEHGVGAMLLRRRRREIKLRRSLLRVFGDVDQYRPRAAGTGDAEGVAHHRRNIFGAGNDIVMLGHRQRDAGNIHFLKGIGAEHFARAPGR